MLNHAVLRPEKLDYQKANWRSRWHRRGLPLTAGEQQLAIWLL
jgi:hypothetical protein